VKLVHLVGFIIQKFVTMCGHTNVKKQGVLIFTYILTYLLTYLLTYSMDHRPS